MLTASQTAKLIAHAINAAAVGVLACIMIGPDR
jgi:hypothetical protein